MLLHEQCLHVEDSVAFGIGFVMNSFNIVALVDQDCLILSDELNLSQLYSTQSSLERL